MLKQNDQKVQEILRSVEKMRDINGEMNKRVSKIEDKVNRIDKAMGEMNENMNKILKQLKTSQNKIYCVCIYNN